MSKKDFLHSNLRERIVEHVFVGDTLRSLWQNNIVDVEVLRSEFDAHGYDLVMTRGAIVRHIQFKTGTSKKPGNVSVSRALGSKPSGCVIWIHINDHLDLGPFYWFGGAPSRPLPNIDHYKVSKHPRRNKKGEHPLRQNHRMVPGAKFEKLARIEELLMRFFGNLSPAGQEPCLEPLIHAKEGIRQGLNDVKEGRVRPAKDFFKEFEARCGILPTSPSPDP